MPPRQLFIVGTGRSGTQSISYALSAEPGVRIAHEWEPRLLFELVDFLEGRMTREEMISLLKRTRAAEVIGGKRLSGEANQRLSFVIPEIRKAFPEAHVLGVIRDGRKVVGSLHHRGWYAENEDDLRGPSLWPWTRSRLRGDRIALWWGKVTTTQWQRMSAFEKCCWYWHVTNELLWHCDLILTLDEVPTRLHQWLGDVVKVPCAPTFEVMNQSERPPLPFSSWAAEDQDAFERWCSPLMERWFPGWREE